MSGAKLLPYWISVGKADNSLPKNTWFMWGYGVLLAFDAPFRYERLLYAQVLQHARHHGIDGGF